MSKRYILFISFFLLLITSCKQKNRFYINQFEKSIEVEIKRFDLDFIDLDILSIEEDIKKLENKYPVFFHDFLSHVLMMDTAVFSEDVNAEYSYSREIKEFLQDSAFIKVHQDVKERFSDINQIEKQLSKAYSYLHYYFPEIRLPEAYFFVSGFNREIVLIDSIIAMGVDLYLGEDYELYPYITHEYLIPNMRKEMVAIDLLKTILYEEFPFIAEANLLNSMIYEGKILYLLSVISPDISDEVLIGYTSDELKWSKQHEKTIWLSIVEQKHLYSTDYFLINQYINVAPFTAPIVTESPGRLGIWVGWKIVQHYMNSNKNIDLAALMDKQNYQEILEQSFYKP